MTFISCSCQGGLLLWQGFSPCVSVNARAKKHAVPEIRCKIGHGIAGGAHAGNWRRQISLPANERVDKMRERGLTLLPGGFAENILTEGVFAIVKQAGTIRPGGAIEIL